MSGAHPEHERTRGAMRVDGAFMLGMTPRDPDYGVTAGLTWVFDAFKVP